MAELNQSELTKLVLSGAIFGRLSPDQKETMLTALRAGGCYVAMIGDDVNDVPALKAASEGMLRAAATWTFCLSKTMNG